MLGDVLTSVRNTIPMVVVGAVVAILVGTLIGVTAGYRQGNARDRLMTGVAMVLYALPDPVARPAAGGLARPLAADAGMSDPFLVDTGFWHGAGRPSPAHRCCPRPVVALMIFGPFALVARSSQLEALGEDHVLDGARQGLPQPPGRLA